jgi:hypothetical protein
MSEEMGSINMNTDLSSDEEEDLSTDPQPTGDIISPVTEERGIEEAMREPGESLETSTIEQPQLEQTRPKKQTTKTTIIKIQF